VLKKHKTAKKTRKARTIVVPRAIADELVALRGSGHAHPERLFAHARSRGGTSVGAGRETGAPWTRPGYSEWFRKLTRRATKEGVALPEGLTLYWLRHSYLTDAQMALDGEKAANLAGNTKEMARGTYLTRASERAAGRGGEGGAEAGGVSGGVTCKAFPSSVFRSTYPDTVDHLHPIEAERRSRPMSLPIGLPSQSRIESSHDPRQLTRVSQWSQYRVHPQFAALRAIRWSSSAVTSPPSVVAMPINYRTSPRV
jgi:hypothetical protein